MEDQNVTIDNLLSELMEMSRTIVDLKDSVTKSQREAEALLARENRYRTILENIPQKIFLKDKNSIYTFCNEAYARGLNLKEEQILDKTDDDLFPMEVAQKYVLDEQRILAAGTAEELEIREQCNGEERFALMMKMPIRDGRGNILGLLGIIRDNNEKKQTEKEIEGLRTRLEEQTAASTAEVQVLKEDLERENSKRQKIEEIFRQTEEARQRMMQENALLAEIDKLPLSVSSQEEAYARSAAEIAKLISYDRFSLSTIQASALLYTPLFSAGLEMANYTPGEALPLSQTIEEEVLKIGTSLLIQKDNPEDVISRFPILLPYLKVGFQSMLIVPLMRGGPVGGMMIFFSTKENAFTPENRELGERLGIKLAQVQLFFELKRAAETQRRNEARSRAFIEGNPLPVFSLDMEGKILEANPAFCSMTDYSLDYLREKSFFSLLISGDMHENQGRLEQAGKGKSQNFESTFLPKEGRPRVEAELTLVPMQVEGKVIGVYGMVRDITEQKRLKENREAFQQKYAYMVDNIPMGIWVCAQEKFKFVNYQCAELLGYPLEEFMGKSLADVVHPDDKEMVLQSYSGWFSGGKLPQFFTARFLHKNGTTRWLQNRLCLIPWDKKEAVLNYAIDITKQVRAQEEFSLTVEKMQTLMKSVEEMIESGRHKETGTA